MPEIKLLSYDLSSHLTIFDSLQELRDPLDQIVSAQTEEDSKDEDKKTQPDKWEHSYTKAWFGHEPGVLKFSPYSLCLCAMYVTWSVNPTQTCPSQFSSLLIRFHQQIIFSLKGDPACFSLSDLSFTLFPHSPQPSVSLRMGLFRREASLKALVTDLWVEHCNSIRNLCEQETLLKVPLSFPVWPWEMRLYLLLCHLC